VVEKAPPTGEAEFIGLWKVYFLTLAECRRAVRGDVVLRGEPRGGFRRGLTPRQSNGWIWFPDITGCVCFLASGRLAIMSVGDGRVVVRVYERTWWVVAVNQVGSILFLLAGVAAFTRPATSDALDVGLVNWGTFAGGPLLRHRRSDPGLRQTNSDKNGGSTQP
jgi:hypothetical protein